jgi:Protein of unknown function (DUF3828)
MPTRRSILFIAAGALGMPCGVMAPAVGADASATAFVTKIYDAYKGEAAKDSDGILLDTDAAIRRYFEPSLAALIVKDRKAAHGEVGALDKDPFIDAQDYEISGVDIAVRDVSPAKAVATVNFTNIDTHNTIALDLVKIKSDWRIANITWQRDGGKKTTLRGLFRH